MADHELPSPVQREGNTTLLIIAIVMALITVVLTNVYLHMVRTEAQQATTTVFKINRNISPGTIIRDKDAVLPSH